MRKRKQKRFHKRSQKTKRQIKKWQILASTVLVLVVVIAIYMTRGWDREEPLAIAYPSESSVVMSVLIPRSNEIYNIKIPSSTQVSVSRNLGEWKIGSVWQLGYNEGIKGRLLAETVSKNFYFPTYYWSSERSDNLINKGLVSGLLSILFPFDTNLSLGDKFSIFLFSQKVPDNNIIDIELKESSVLKQTKLTDGSEGYLVDSIPAQSLLSLFNNSEIVQKARIVQIKDATGNLSYVETITQLMWVLGANVTSIVASDKSEGCLVEAKDAESAEIVSKLINCDTEISREGEYDLIIYLPENHMEKF